MKKTILALMLGLLLTGCASNVENNVDSDTDSTSTAVTQEDSEADDNEEKNNDSTSLPRMNPYTADDDGYCANFDVVKFGSYEQDGIDNGTEAIEWYVVAREDGKALLLSKYVLFLKEYNHDSSDELTWENCDLRKYLNENFYNDAFVDNEKDMIVATTLINNDNPAWDTIGGNDTVDNVFILSLDEIAKYFTFNYEDAKGRNYDYVSEDLYSVGTDACYIYDSDKEFYRYEESYYRTVSNKCPYSNKLSTDIIQPLFWVRSPGGNKQWKICVCAYGCICEDNSFGCNDTSGVRPAIWVDEAALTMYQ